MAGAAAGLVFDVKRFAVHDGPGIRTTVFLKGCSLRCRWCHSPESQSPEPEVLFSAALCIGCGACAAACPNGLLADGPARLDRSACQACGRCAAACNSGALVMIGRPAEAGEIVARLDRDRMLYAASGGGVTLSGGEPALQSEFAAAVLRTARARGHHTVLETAGHVPWPHLAALLDCTDLVLFDVKHASPRAHLELTGAGNERILDNLRRVSALALDGGPRLIVRCPVIPGLNDAPDDIAALAGVLAGLLCLERVELLPYHDLGVPKYAALGRPYLPGLIPTPSRTALRSIAVALGGHGFEVSIEGVGLDDPA